jgi:hypothetical protein
MAADWRRTWVTCETCGAVGWLDYLVTTWLQRWQAFQPRRCPRCGERALMPGRRPWVLSPRDRIELRVMRIAPD